MRIALACLLLLVTPSPNPAAGNQLCRARETAIVVSTHAHSLDLCQDGRSVARHRVALGAGGIGKRRVGDGKTPLGPYPLGSPRASRWFGTFVPVGYPTSAQRRLGFSGNAIGIHGPPRNAPDDGAASVFVDWTAGCIAVGSDRAITAIADWIRRYHPHTVRIE